MEECVRVEREGWMMRQVRRAPILADICGHLRTSGRCLIAGRHVLRACILFHYVSFCYICVHPADAEGDERGARLFHDCLSSMVNRPSSDMPPAGDYGL